MNVLTTLQRLSVVFLLSLPTLAMASEKGQLNFADLSATYGEPKVEVNLAGAMMGFVRGMTTDDPETQAILQGVEAIRVLVYNTQDKSQKAIDEVDKMSAKIRKDNWVPIVSVNEERERIRMFAKYTGDTMEGLVVMVVNTGDATGQSPGEVVFLNIVGQINPANVQKVTQSLKMNVGL